VLGKSPQAENAEGEQSEGNERPSQAMPQTKPDHSKKYQMPPAKAPHRAPFFHNVSSQAVSMLKTAAAMKSAVAPTTNPANAAEIEHRPMMPPMCSGGGRSADNTTADHDGDSFL
jgi:hypothetical protein